MPVSYGEWLNYVLRAEGVDKDQLSRHTGMSVEHISQLATKGAPQPPEAEIDRIAAALNISKANMDRSLRAMQVYNDLKSLKNDCGGACCPWNAPVD